MKILSFLFLVASFSLSSGHFWTTADLRPKNYNNLRPPKSNETGVVDVKVSVEIISILSVNEFEQVIITLCKCNSYIVI